MRIKFEIVITIKFFRIFFRTLPISDHVTFFNDYVVHEKHFVYWDRRSEMNVSRDNRENV